jgi:hypothetical protein
VAGPVVPYGSACQSNPQCGYESLCQNGYCGRGE